MNFLIINKGTKIKAHIFSFQLSLQTNKGKIKLSLFFFLSFLSYIQSPNTSKGFNFFSFSSLFLFPSSFPFFFLSIATTKHRVRLCLVEWKGREEKKKEKREGKGKRVGKAIKVLPNHPRRTSA